MTLSGMPLGAQELEPRAYANVPVGLNFLVVGYARSEGGVAADATVPLTNASMRIDSTFMAYARALAFGGRSAKLDLLLPQASLNGTAEFGGLPVGRSIGGLGDPRLRFSANLFGAPARTLGEFSGYRQDLIVGASVQVTIPVGQYDSRRVVNIGSNRWVVKPEIGLSKAMGPWTMELAGAVILFADNEDFLGGTRSQDPIYSVQANVIRSLPGGVWVALGGTRYAGGRTRVDGLRRNDMQENTRLGVILSLPVGQASLKVFGNTGVSVRTGSDFDALGLAWQYRWGGRPL